MLKTYPDAGETARPVHHHDGLDIAQRRVPALEQRGDLGNQARRIGAHRELGGGDNLDLIRAGHAKSDAGRVAAGIQR